MNAAEHMQALLGEDPFVLAEQIREAAAEAGRARAEANHLERIRKVKRAEIARTVRDNATQKMTIPEVDDAAHASPLYREHLDIQRTKEIEAATAEAHYYALRNRQDWLQKAADSLRAEAYLAR